MNIIVTLNSGLGADLGPNFNLTADVGSVTPNTATKDELLAGKFVNVDPSANQITITSVGTCTTSIILSITGRTTTTTSTSTTSTTTTAPESFSLGFHGANFFSACLAFGTSPTTYYAATGQSLQIGTILYSNQTLTTTVLNGFYSNGTDWWRVTGGLGQITSTGSCSTTTTTSTTSTSTSTTSTTSTTTQASTTTTTLAAQSVSLGFDSSVGWQSCYAIQTTYYIPPGTNLENGTFIYTDSALTTKPINGYYSNGSNYWYVDDGELTLETPCPTTTTTSTTSTTSTSTSTTTTSTSTTSTSTSTTTTSSTSTTTTAAPTTTTTTVAPTTTSTTTTTQAPTTTTTQPGETTTTSTSSTSTTTTQAPTTTTSTSTSTSTTTTTAAPQCNYDGLTVTCDATTTTTTTSTTSTTTEAPTTTTTTVSAACEEYINNTSSTFNVSYLPCGGSQYVNEEVGPNQSICMEPGTGGGDWAFLTYLGIC